MRTYITKEGDTWDSIAKTYFDNEFVVDDLMSIQDEKVLMYYSLPSGLEILIPDNQESEITYFKAPWS